jgi:hypothetical protein
MLRFEDENASDGSGYPSSPDRRRRIEVFCRAYGIADPEDVVSLVADQQRTVLRIAEALGGGY